MKKQEFYAKQAEAERRKAEIEEEKQRELEQKRLDDLKRDEYRLNVRNNMVVLEEGRKNQIQQAREEKERKMREISEKRMHDLILQREEENQKLLQKRQTVERIMRANEYHKH